MVEVHANKPDQFNSQIETSACFLEVSGKILLLQNALNDSEPEKWGVPAGKREANEAPWQTAIRELHEETGIAIGPSQIVSLGPLFIRKPNFEYIFHLFHIKLATTPAVQISAEHKNYQWVSSEEIESLPLMAGAIEAFRHFTDRKPK